MLLSFLCEILTCQHVLRRVAELSGLTMCPAETPPFTKDPLFADPKAMADSHCSFASAEGRFRFWPRQVCHHGSYLAAWLCTYKHQSGGTAHTVLPG